MVNVPAPEPATSTTLIDRNDAGVVRVSVPVACADPTVCSMMSELLLLAADVPYGWSWNVTDGLTMLASVRFDGRPRGDGFREFAGAPVTFGARTPCS